MLSFLRWSLTLLLVTGGGAAFLVGIGTIALPPRYDPWAPLDIQATPNLLTRFKLARLESDSQQCRAVLAGTRLRFTPAPDRVSDNGCGLWNAVQVSGSDVAFDRSFTATCPLAVAWMLFEIHALQPAAERHFGRRLARVQHLGTYACRNLYGHREGRRSEHATANAMDVAAFILHDGTRISFSRDWSRDNRNAAFLHDIRDGACRFFDVVLSPDYNEAHRDHLHIDMGPFRACR